MGSIRTVGTTTVSTRGRDQPDREHPHLARFRRHAGLHRFAFTSCQHYEVGYFNGYPHMQKEDLDLVIHLGDYIYEYAGVDKRIGNTWARKSRASTEYRQRYAQYRLDEDLRRRTDSSPGW